MPSKGATKATRSILLLIEPSLYRSTEYSDALMQRLQKEIPAIIDRETNAGESLECCKRLLAEYQKAHPCLTDHKAEAAITAAEEGETDA